MRKMRDAHRILVGKLNDRWACHFVDIGPKWKDNIRMDLIEKTKAACGLDSCGSSGNGIQISDFLKFGKFLH
jgi:hypothetical protein